MMRKSSLLSHATLSRRRKKKTQLVSAPLCTATCALLTCYGLVLGIGNCVNLLSVMKRTKTPSSFLANMATVGERAPTWIFLW